MLHLPPSIAALFLGQSLSGGSASVVVIVLLSLLALVVVPVLLVYVAVPAAKGVGRFVRHIAIFIWRTLADSLRCLGALLLAIVYVPLTLGSVVIGRWSAARHFGNALTSELTNAGLSLYRFALGNPARLFLLDGLTEGIEKRLPAVLAAAPTADSPRNTPPKAATSIHNANTSDLTSDAPQDQQTGSPRRAQFDGYVIVGSLPSGGSGAKLYVAEPDEFKAAAFIRDRIDVGQVVIKSFSLTEGSSLPQIVRESRSLDAAKRMGLILDHHLAADKFYYVMRYVPGESLSLVTKQLHASSPPAVFNQIAGLGNPQLKAAIQYVIDVVASLGAYHRGGLWHKDVKPDNIIVATRTDRRAHLVDFGLVSSLRSAMTLTTHGTEYFRDPELVRRALRGVKVHEVDGTRFDLYAAGAVLYAVIEDSFPAHGVLSQFSKRCPDAVKWIVRRAMTDYDKRYTSAHAMLADLQFVALAADPFDVKPFSLPSVVAGASPDDQVTFEPGSNPAAAAAASAFPPPLPNVTPQHAYHAPHGPAAPRRAPSIRVTNWWSGQVAVDSSTLNANNPIEQSALPVSDAVATAKQMAEQAVLAAQAGMTSISQTFSARSPRTPKASTTPQDSPPPLPHHRRQLVDPSLRKPAAQQLESARLRSAAALLRINSRSKARNADSNAFRTGLRGGVTLSVCILVGLLIGGAITIYATLSQPTLPSPFVVTYSDAAPPTHAGPALDESAAFEEDTTAVSRLTSLAPTPPPPPSTPALPVSPTRGIASSPCTVLIISDLQQPWSPAAAASISTMLATLEGLNIQIRGENPTLAQTQPRSEADVDLAASLRFAIGQTPPTSSSFAQRIQAWLAAQPKGTPPLVLWISPREGATEFPQIHTVLAQNEANPCAQLPRSLQSAFNEAR